MPCGIARSIPRASLPPVKGTTRLFSFPKYALGAGAAQLGPSGAKVSLSLSDLPLFTMNN